MTIELDDSAGKIESGLRGAEDTLMMSDEGSVHKVNGNQNDTTDDVGARASVQKHFRNIIRRVSKPGKIEHQ